jgi:hypothetical protein
MCVIACFVDYYVQNSLFFLSVCLGHQHVVPEFDEMEVKKCHTAKKWPCLSFCLFMKVCHTMHGNGQRIVFAVIYIWLEF